jgi:hypothetical protein
MCAVFSDEEAWRLVRVLGFVVGRNVSEQELATIAGPIQTKFCALAQYSSFVCIMIGYTITASISMV